MFLLSILIFVFIIQFCFCLNEIGSVVDVDVATTTLHAENHATVDSHLRWLAVGDWGGTGNGESDKPYTTSAQWTTARSMGQVARSIDAAFVVTTGDNFYQNGVVDVDDERFEFTFEDVYHDEALRSMPWYIVAGNHDHLGNISAQIDYTRKSTRWNFPSEWYTKRFEMRPKHESKVVSVQFIFLDGTLFNAQYLNRPFVQVSKNYKEILKSKIQLIWLEETLIKASENSDWIIVVGHYPIMSVAEYSGYPSLITNIQPLLEKYNVALYLNGHTHTLQHLKHNQVDYLVIGCGAVANVNRWNWFNVPFGSLRFCYPDAKKQNQNQMGQFTKGGKGGFASFDLLNSTHLTFHFHNQNGNIIYSSTKINPKR